MILALEQRRPGERPGPPKLREVYCGCENDSRAHTAHGITGLEEMVVRVVIVSGQLRNCEYQR